MDDKTRQVIEVMTKAVGMMTDSEKERLLSYGEGLTFKLERRENSEKATA